MRRACAAVVWRIFFLSLGVAGFCPESPSETLHDTVLSEDAVISRESEVNSRWYVVFMAQNLYPELQDEKLIRKFFDVPMETLTFGYREVKTFGDRRDDALMWAPQIGLGRDVSDRWTVMFMLGYSGGWVRTEETYPSVFLLPLHIDFKMTRSGVYAVIGADFYPLGMPERGVYSGIWSRLRAAKPVLGARASWAYNTFDAKVKLGLKPFPNFVDAKVDMEWSIQNFYPNIGVEIPTGEQSTVALTGSYNFATDEKENLSGPAMNLTWKYYFKHWPLGTASRQ